MADAHDDLLKRLSAANEQNYQVMQERMQNLMTGFAEFKGDVRGRIVSVEQTTRNIEQSLAEIKQGVAVLREQKPLEEIKELELRVRALENWRWYMLGIMAVMAPGIAVLTAWATKALTR